MKFNFKILFLFISLAISSSECATCRFFVYGGFNDYGCELSDAFVTNEDQIFEISGEHLPGRNDSHVMWLNATNSVTLNVIPARIFERFPVLLNLDLSEVRMKRIQRESFGECIGIDLNLRGNLIEAIPERTFYNCSYGVINLDENRITSIGSQAFSGIRFLRDLVLSNNLLTTLPENVFSRLTSLRNLYLENNRLTHLAANLLSDSSGLRILNLDNNRLVEVPPQIFIGKQLFQRVYLRNNLILNFELVTGEIDMFDLSALTVIYLDQNRMTSLSANTFLEAPRLTMIQVSGNNLNSIHPETFNRRTTHIFVSIVSIDLSVNNLREIAPGTFDRLHGLQELRLNSNNLVSLPNGIFADCRCNSFHELDLSNNNLNVIHSQLFQGASNIRELNLSSNSISAIDRNMLGSLQNLRNLFLSGNPCINSDFRDITENDISNIHASLEECFRNYDNLTPTTPGDTTTEGVIGTTTPGKSSVIESSFFILVLVQMILYQFHI